MTTEVVCHNGPFDIDVKRFYFPVTLVAPCPGCGTRVDRDFRRNYLSYPTAGKAFEVSMYHDCDEEHAAEWTVKCRLAVILSVVPNDGGGDEP